MSARGLKTFFSGLLTTLRQVSRAILSFIDESQFACLSTRMHTIRVKRKVPATGSKLLDGVLVGGIIEVKILGC